MSGNTAWISNELGDGSNALKAADRSIDDET